MKTLAVSSIFCLIGASAFAESFYTVPEAPDSTSSGYGNIGINFTVNQSVDVSALSFFGIGLSSGDTPFVQLWNVDTTTVIADVAWSAGTAVAGWNTIRLASAVTLTTGTNYQLQANAYSAPIYSEDDFTYSSVVGSTSYTNGAMGGWWDAPSAPSSGTATTSPAAIASLTFVPEPSSFALIGGCLSLALVMTRRGRV
jgi:hypothetical protein